MLVGVKLAKDRNGIWVEAAVDKVKASDELELSAPEAVTAGGVLRAEVVGDRLEAPLARLTLMVFRISGLCQYCGAASITT